MNALAKHEISQTHVRTSFYALFLFLFLFSVGNILWFHWRSVMAKLEFCNSEQVTLLSRTHAPLMKVGSCCKVGCRRVYRPISTLSDVVYMNWWHFSPTWTSANCWNVESERSVAPAVVLNFINALLFYSFLNNKLKKNHKCCSECPMYSSETDSALQCLDDLWKQISL